MEKITINNLTIQKLKKTLQNQINQKINEL